MLPTKFRFIWPSGCRGEFFFKSANQKQELPMAAMFVNGSGQNEQSVERTIHRCFLPSFTSFGSAVSEEKIKMWNVNGWQTTDAKWWQKLTLSLTRWAKNNINVQTFYSEHKIGSLTRRADNAMAKRNRTWGQWSTKHYMLITMLSNLNLREQWGWRWCSRSLSNASHIKKTGFTQILLKVSSFCSTSGTRRVTLC